VTLSQIQRKLKQLKEEGYVDSLRSGPTGIGYTFEEKLGLAESNIPMPDLGGRVELKASRRKQCSLITLFTFNKAAWHLAQKDFILRVGHLDSKGRMSLYSSVWPLKWNKRGLSLLIDEPGNMLNLIHNKDSLVASWDIYAVLAKMLSKMAKLLFVIADYRRQENSPEQFHYNEAHLFEDPTAEKFINAVKDSKVCLDIRMHIKKDGSVRNHGTGFRIRQNELRILFSKRRRVI